jgi:hypothetical protein
MRIYQSGLSDWADTRQRSAISRSVDNDGAERGGQEGCEKEGAMWPRAASHSQERGERGPGTARDVCICASVPSRLALQACFRDTKQVPTHRNISNSLEP